MPGDGKFPLHLGQVAVWVKPTSKLIHLYTTGTGSEAANHPAHGQQEASPRPHTRVHARAARQPQLHTHTHTQTTYY